MTQTRRLSTMAVVIAGVLAMSATALGGRPDKPGGGGGAEHPPGMTCAVGSPDNAYAFTNGFIIDFDSKNGGSACVDWTTTSATTWHVTVTGARSAGFNIRDSHPGDFCWNASGTDLTAAHTNGPLATGGGIPVAAIDACGTEYTDDAPSLVFTFHYRGSGKVKLSVQPTS